MRISFGYVAMALNIAGGSPNKTVTATNLMKIPEPSDRINRLRRLTGENLAAQLRILRYNAAHGIRVFRFTSRLVPLATHPLAGSWDYISEFAAELRAIGEYAKQHGMRVSAHPDHYTLLNAPNPQVLAASLADLDYHAGLFDAMGLGAEAKLVVHVGGGYNDKNAAMERFARNFRRLPPGVKSRLVVENDDRIYTAADTLSLCRALAIPMVLDVHHHMCCNQGEDIAALLPDIFATWRDMSPKVHLSSPRPGNNIRAHADYVEIDDFLPFLKTAAQVGRDFAVMLEAKQKDRALFRLMEDLRLVDKLAPVGEAAVEYGG